MCTQLYTIHCLERYGKSEANADMLGRFRRAVIYLTRPLLSQPQDKLKGLVYYIYTYLYTVYISTLHNDHNATHIWQNCEN